VSERGSPLKRRAPPAHPLLGTVWHQGGGEKGGHQMVQFPLTPENGGHADGHARDIFCREVRGGEGNLKGVSRGEVERAAH